MLISFETLLSKIDYRLSPRAFSRPQYQVKLLIQELKRLRKSRFKNILDIGGGPEAQYKETLKEISLDYINLDIKRGPRVDKVGSIYRLPFAESSFDLVTLFMVLEHLADPLVGLKDCQRVLRRNGYMCLTTVQYWHTHHYPNDYYRYTKHGLIYLCKKAGFKIEKMWSHGGPFLVIFHSIEINLPNILRTIFSILFFRAADFLDWRLFKHYDRRLNSDSVGWSLIAKKI